MIALLCVFGGLSYQYFATKRDDWRYPPPGKFIDVGGYKLHLLCTGQNGPTVVFDAGLSANLNWWHFVQKEVSQFAKGCSFDRAGYGWSEASNVPRTSEQIVLELHILLHATAATPPPYILVGHSFGGANMRLYTNTYPDEVEGLILVDACHQDQRFEDDSLGKGVLALFKDYVFNSSFSHYIGLSRWFMAENLKPYFSSLMSHELRELIIAKASTIKSLRARDNEMVFLKESLAQLKKSKNALSNKPLIIITAEETNNDPSWQAYQKELVFFSNKGKQIIADGSSHMIHVDQPEIITEAIRELVESLKVLK